MTSLYLSPLSEHAEFVRSRMRPEISVWPVEQFYDGVVVDGPNVCAEEYDRLQVRSRLCC